MILFQPVYVKKIKYVHFHKKLTKIIAIKRAYKEKKQVSEFSVQNNDDNLISDTPQNIQLS